MAVITAVRKTHVEVTNDNENSMSAKIRINCCYICQCLSARNSQLFPTFIEIFLLHLGTETSKAMPELN